jgi:hypothetical protein
MRASRVSVDVESSAFAVGERVVLPDRAADAGAAGVGVICRIGFWDRLLDMQL